MTIVGRVLADRYAVGELLGRGGMAEVYLGTDRVLDRPVAVKVLGNWLDGSFEERFRREALAAARISHPNLVAVYDTGSEGGIHYIVMEHVPGRTLADELRRGGPPGAERAAGIAVSVADALGVAHAAGIVHRDVKPANVMLTPDGRTKLMDLGIARSLGGESLTRSSTILGTAGYISPEQARGEPVDHRSDIYSLGCVLYEMLAGRPPFQADHALAVAYKHVHEDPVPPSAVEPTVPPGLDAVALRAMAKDPAARFSSAADMAAAIEDRTVALPAPAVTTPMPLGTPMPRPPSRTDRTPRRRSTAAILLALAGVVLLVGVAFAMLAGEDPVTGGPPAGRRARLASPSPSPSPTPTAAQTPPPTDDPVEAATAAILALVEEGLADGTISEKAAEEIRKRVEESLKKFDEGNTEEAMHQLEELESKVDELVEGGEIAHSREQQIDRALEDLWERFSVAAPPDDDDD